MQFHVQFLKEICTWVRPIQCTIHTVFSLIVCFSYSLSIIQNHVSVTVIFTLICLCQSKTWCYCIHWIKIYWKKKCFWWHQKECCIKLDMSGHFFAFIPQLSQGVDDANAFITVTESTWGISQILKAQEQNAVSLFLFSAQLSLNEISMLYDSKPEWKSMHIMICK